MPAKTQLFAHPQSLLLSVVIVSYNTKELTLAAVQSVVATTNTSSLSTKELEILIVDNNSSDGSVTALERYAQRNHKHQITIIKNKTNLGFSKANNQAIKASRGEYIFLLNSDAKVTATALEQLLQTLTAHPPNQVTAVLERKKEALDNLGILSATLLNPDSSLQAQGGSLPTLISLAAHFLFLDDLPLVGRLLPSTQHTGKSSQKSISQKLKKVGWVAGTAVIIKRSVFLEIGLLDEAIFMYGEDVEFCLRAAQHHIDCAIDPRALVFHMKSASSSSAGAILGEVRGYQHIWKKHKPSWEYPLMRGILLLGGSLRWFLYRFFSKNKQKTNAYKQVVKLLLQS